MDLLKQRILKDGNVIMPDILRVDSFESSNRLLIISENC